MFLIGWHDEEKRLLVELLILLDRTSLLATATGISLFLSLGRETDAGKELEFGCDLCDGGVACDGVFGDLWRVETSMPAEGVLDGEFARSARPGA